jgi:hypothetical protein
MSKWSEIIINNNRTRESRLKLVHNDKAMVSSRPTKLAYLKNRFHRLFTIADVRCFKAYGI